ncbi:hypothetical protein [Reinekea sp.]|jgi:hypothetical protein|uniref:tetratricopeptide repeat protein n=1 Tax=Reinekea sp. TaxID=1970455 RepID=UPI002A832FB9|nr:hypothetical protein [Reinekea sp.]
MDAAELYESLLSHTKVDQERLNAIFIKLPRGASVGTFRTEILHQGLLPYTEVMGVFVNNFLLPRSRKLLNTIKQKRLAHSYFKPESHKQKFHLKDMRILDPVVALAQGTLAIPIPPLDKEQFTFQSSDEKQAVLLAIDLVAVGEINETEIVLLETLDTFSQSEAAIQVLCWLYMCSGLPQQAEHWALNFLATQRGGSFTIELLSLAQQVQNKHLLASAYYQQLLRQSQVRSQWYLLLAYSQEQSQCPTEALQNYKTYSTVGQDESFKTFAATHSKGLTER